MKIISLFLIICILHSCLAYKRVEVPKNPLPVSGSKLVVLHTDNLTLYLKKFSVSNDTIHGNVLHFSSKRPDMHLYVDSVMIKPKPGEKILVPVKSISIVKTTEIDTWPSFFYTTGCLAIIFGFLWSIDFDIIPNFGGLQR
jgi:hypothetical protein